MKFKSYVIFFLLFGVLPDIFFGVTLLKVASLGVKLLLCLPTAAALVYLVRIGRAVRYTESLRVFSSTDFFRVFI